jgi:hypothetical protein
MDLQSDLKTDFPSYWKGIVGEDTSFDDRMAAAEVEWNANPEKHIPIMLWLRRHGPYPGRNPYFFIQDFKVRQAALQLPPPTNYQGRALPAGKTVVSARYKDGWGFYTIEDALAHGMDIRYPDHIFTTDRRIVDQINNHVDWVQVSVPYMTADFIFCSRKNAEKYHLKILADPRNPVDQPTS